MNVHELAELEEKISAGVPLTLIRAEKATSNHRLYDLLMKSCDARKAELLTVKDAGVNSLLRLRTLMFRGKLEEAKRLADDIPESTTRTPPLEQVELMLEKARIFAYEGSWQSCIALCTRAINSAQAAPVSLLSLFQVRSLARSELGFLHEALRDLTEADSLIELFPNAQSGFYCKVLRIRLTARHSDTSPAYSRALESLWKLAREMDQVGELNADYLLSILLAEVELRRFQGTCIATSVAACFRLCELMGESLYAALSLIGVLSCGDATLLGAYSARKETDLRQFKRVRFQWDDLDSSHPTTETSRSMKRQICGKDHFCLTPELFDQASRCEWLLLPSLPGLVRLNPWETRQVRANAREATILNAFENRAVSRDVFFRSIWNTKYVAHLHDGLTWTTLDRFAKKFGIKVENRKSGILVNNAWVLKS